MRKLTDMTKKSTSSCCEKKRKQDERRHCVKTACWSQVRRYEVVGGREVVIGCRGGNESQAIRSVAHTRAEGWYLHRPKHSVQKYYLHFWRMVMSKTDVTERSGSFGLDSHKNLVRKIFLFIAARVVRIFDAKTSERWRVVWNQRNKLLYFYSYQKISNEFGVKNIPELPSISA